MLKSRLIGIGFLILCGLTLLAVSLGWFSPEAPLDVIPTPGASEPVTVEVVYSTEKEQWIEESVESWLATDPEVRGRPVEVSLSGAGSQAMVAGLRSGELRPTVVSPASSLQIRQINASTIEGDTDIAADSEALVHTPLVIVAWEPRAPDEPAAELSKSGNDLWLVLQKQVVEHSSDRSFLFGQTSPGSSNSGLQTFALMAYAYHGKRSGLTVDDVDDPGFRRWMARYTSGVESFGESTGTLMEDMVRYGPSRYSAIAVYESAALFRIEAAEDRRGPVTLIYPPANLTSDHPYAVLDAPWVTPEEREAAMAMRGFLLSDESQRAAVGYGFRPANDDVRIDGPGSPFARYGEYGVKRQVGPPVEEPSAEVVEALLELWSEMDHR